VVGNYCPGSNFATALELASGKTADPSTALRSGRMTRGGGLRFGTFSDLDGRVANDYLAKTWWSFRPVLTHPLKAVPFKNLDLSAPCKAFNNRSFFAAF
jgi:hypothetical protein